MSPSAPKGEFDANTGLYANAIANGASELAR